MLVTRLLGAFVHVLSATAVCVATRQLHVFLLPLSALPRDHVVCLKQSSLTWREEGGKEREERKYVTFAIFVGAALFSDKKYACL